MDLTAIIVNVQPALIALVVPLIVAGLKRITDRIPKPLTPVIAAALGPITDQVLALLAHIPSLGWKGAIAGLAGVGIREVVDQFKKA